MAAWRLFIPTRDSARYVGIFLDHYRRLGVEPLYVVDGRSVDGTIDLLRSKAADFCVVSPSGNFFDGEMAKAACESSHTAWMLRMDDDEFPSKALIDFVASFTCDAAVDNEETYLFNREWVKSAGPDNYTFYRVPRMISNIYFDVQRRLFRNRNLTFDYSIHTVGVKTKDESLRFAPFGAFIVHFDAILKSSEEKIAKIRRYEQIAPSSAWHFSDLYITEYYNDQAYILFDDGLAEFVDLIKALPPVETKRVRLTEKERQSMLSFCPSGLDFETSQSSSLAGAFASAEISKAKTA